MNRKHIAQQSVVLQQFGALLGAGLTFHESARMLAQESRFERDKVFFAQLADEVSGGRTVSDVLGEWRWSTIAVTLIRVGELSGSLAKSCDTAARELSYRVAVKKKIIGMMLYPACVFVCALCLIVSIVGFVFPKILPVLESTRGTLPFSTRVVLGVTGFLSHYGVVVGAIVGVTLFALYGSYKKFDAVRRWLSIFILKVPFVGNVIRLYIVAQVLRTISVLSAAHIDVVDCIDRAHETITNHVYRYALRGVKESVVQGDSLSRSLAVFPKLFPATTISMIAVAEQSGSLSEMSRSLSALYESEYTNSIEQFAKLIEPVLMICLGLVVGFIAISIITPIYEITTHVQR